MLISLEENNIKELRVITPPWIETQYLRKCPEGRFSEIIFFSQGACSKLRREVQN